MKRSLIFSQFLFVLWIEFSFAQTVTLSPAPVEDNNFDNVKVIGQDEEGFFLLQSNLPFDIDRDRVGFKNRKYKITYYSNELVARWSKAIEPMPHDATIEAITFLQQKILITTAIESKSQDKLTLYGEWMNNKGEIIKITEIGSMNFEKNTDYDKAKLVVSTDQRLIGLIVHEYIDDNKQAVHFLMTDTSFNAIQNKNFTINYGQKHFTATGYSLSNKGDFHMIGVRTIKDKNAERKRQEDFILFSAPQSASQLSEFLVGEGSKNITSASINFDNLNNKLVCAGFYSDRNSTSGAGIIYSSLDMNNPSKLAVKTHPINSGIQIKLLGERNSGYDMGLVSYPIEKIILRNDGGAVIVAEASFTTDYSYYDYFTQSYTRRTEFHYNNIVVTSVNSDGSIHWLDMIRKEQESEDDGGVFSSFCSMLTPDELVFIYNDNITRNSEVVSAVVSNTGEQKENKIVRSDNRILLLARSGKQISENEVVIPCVAKKKLMLAKFIF